MTSSTDKTLTQKELEGWLTTMHVATDRQPNSGPPTIRPVAASLQPLLQAFAASLPGSSAAPIKVGATLAEGGMGIVKLAEQHALGRTVVVKTLRGDYAEIAAEHVLREAWATGALEHPNIVPVHDIRVDEQGAPLIVLKKIEGDCWTVLMHDPDKLKERFAVTDPLDWNLDILRQVCQAVRYAHSRGILHRDLKPDNVMIGEFGEVYLVDWGIALSLRDSPGCPLPSAKNQSAMAGTPCYLAPEMLGGSDLDARTDIYLLGSVLFEILAGKPPHRTDDLQTLLADIRASSPRIPESAAPGLASICLRAMARDPDHRFPDASAFAVALQVYEQTRGSQRLADEARAQRLAMTACLAAEDIDEQEAYRCFGAARFGYETALATWPENPTALAELDDALVAMIEFELGRGRIDSARGLLQHLHSAPEGLLERIAVEAAKAANALAELAKYRDDSNLDLGGRTRLFLTFVLGLLFTLIPLEEHFWGTAIWRDNYGRMIASSFSLWGLYGLFWLWARESLTRTEINRRITLTLMTIFPSQILLYLGASRMDLSFLHAELLMMLLWTTLAIFAVATVERRFWPTMLAYGEVFYIASGYPDQRFLAMAIGNFTFMCNGVYIWYTPESRPQFKRFMARRRSAGSDQYS